MNICVKEGKPKILNPAFSFNCQTLHISAFVCIIDVIINSWRKESQIQSTTIVIALLIFMHSHIVLQTRTRVCNIRTSIRSCNLYPDIFSPSVQAHKWKQRETKSRIFERVILLCQRSISFVYVFVCYMCFTFVYLSGVFVCVWCFLGKHSVNFVEIKVKLFGVCLHIDRSSPLFKYLCADWDSLSVETIRSGGNISH